MGRVFRGVSTVICIRTSPDHEVVLAAGARAGVARLCEVVRKVGCTRVGRAMVTIESGRTPFSTGPG